MAWWQLPVTDGKVWEQIKAVFSELIDQCDGVLVPRLSGERVITGFISDRDQLGGVVCGGPVMMSSLASALADVARPDGGPKVAAVLRSCEARAFVELCKLNQIDPDQVIVVGVDCGGSMHPRTWQEMVSDCSVDDALISWYGQIMSGERDNDVVRSACKMCVSCEVSAADVHFGIIGTGDKLLIRFGEGFEHVADKVGAETADEAVVEKRAAAILNMQKEGASAKAEQVSEYEGSTIMDVAESLSGCIQCLNCRRACPICYCRECAFETMLFEHPPDQYRKWAQRKGAVKIPADTTLFHLTRMNHVGPSCVSCGLCEMVCPMDLPLTGLFVTAAGDVQELFDYVSGADREQPLPYTTFEEQELEPR